MTVPTPPGPRSRVRARPAPSPALPPSAADPPSSRLPGDDATTPVPSRRLAALAALIRRAAARSAAAPPGDPTPVPGVTPDTATAAPPSPGPGGDAHMPYLRAIWAAPLDAAPLRRYADWLAAAGLGGTAAYYRRKAADVTSGRLRPDYQAPSWLDEHWD